MNIKELATKPVFASVISIFIVLVGLICLFGLPVEKYPDIAPPTVQIATTYSGASADAIQKSVVMPIEEQVNGVDNMMYITSSSSNSGDVEILVYFEQGTDPDMAAVNVQNRVSQIQGILPAEVTKMGVVVSKRQPSMLRVFGVCSPNGTYDEEFLSNYAQINIKPEIQRIHGVGTVVCFSGSYAMCVWLDPSKMASHNLIPEDIAGLLADQNIEAPIGILGENSRQIFQTTMKYRGRHITEEEFENLVISTLPDGGELRLKDVATLELGLDKYAWKAGLDGAPGAGLAIYQIAGSNATDINNEIDALFEKMKSTLPNDVEIITLENGNDFLFASIDSVVETLVIAIILVVLVVLFFLQDIRATLIPSISIIVSLVGTFAFLQVAGFSINLLTLFSLVLVIGTVVDDTIVVVEAVQERFDHGYKDGKTATLDAVDGLINALFTTTLVFMMVFIPVSFMGGTTGIFYRQFGLTMAVAVGISLLCAISLAPALCAILMNPLDGTGFSGWLKRIYDKFYNWLLAKYAVVVKFFIQRVPIVAVIIILSLAALFWIMSTTKTGMVPEEDKGSIYISVSTPVGTSVKETFNIMSQIDAELAKIPEVDHRLVISGQSFIGGVGSNQGICFVRLKPWGEREGAGQDVNSVIMKIYLMTAHIKAAQIYCMAPPMIDGYGTGNGFEFHVQDRQGGQIADLYNVTVKYLEELNKRPEIGSAMTTYDISYPQYVVDVDAAKCKRQGILPSEVLSCLSGYYGGIYASNFSRFGKSYKVMVLGRPDLRMDEESLNNVYVRLKNGEMAPAIQFLTLTKVYEPMQLNRFNLFNSISVNGQPADGYSSGQAIKAIKEVAASTLPQGYSIDYAGLTREQEKNGSGNLGMVFAICILFIYLIMSALYESFMIPFAVVLSVPVGLFGAFVFIRMYGLQNDIYLQVGLIMLIGLISKTAILLTEYATQCRKAGMTLAQAAFFSAKMRLRPILMTVLTMIFGMIPMLMATGSGANANKTIAAATIGGMIFGTLALLFFVPSMFIIFQGLQEKLKPIEFETSEDSVIRNEVERLKASKDNE